MLGEPNSMIPMGHYFPVDAAFLSGISLKDIAPNLVEVDNAPQPILHGKLPLQLRQTLNSPFLDNIPVFQYYY